LGDLLLIENKVVHLANVINPFSPVLETLGKGWSEATHTDIWWWLRGRKLHHVAPDVSRLVPGGCGRKKKHAEAHVNTQHIHIYTQEKKV